MSNASLLDEYLLLIPEDQRTSDVIMEFYKIMFGLNENAWEVFTRSSDKSTLKQALSWSNRSLRLSPENSQFLDTCANLLYKLGRKKDAVVQEEKALSFANKENAEGIKQLQENLQKMKAGEKTW